MLVMQMYGVVAKWMECLSVSQYSGESQRCLVSNSTLMLILGLENLILYAFPFPSKLYVPVANFVSLESISCFSFPLLQNKLLKLISYLESTSAFTSFPFSQYMFVFLISDA